MKKIEVSSLPIKEVIKDLARAFNTEVIEKFGEYKLHLPEHVGAGYITGINFDSGLGLIIYHCNFNEDTQISYIVDEIHPLKFLYILNGHVTHSFQGETTLHNLEQYQNAIVSSSFNNGHILNFKSNVETTLNSVEMVVERFTQRLLVNFNDVDDGLKELFNDVRNDQSFYHNGFFSLKTADLFKELVEFERTDMVRVIFLEGMTYQVLSQEIIEYLDDKFSDSDNLLRKTEINQIKNAADYIGVNISDSLTVEEIAQEVGLNINKLQQGFKIMYGNTVNTYVQKKRFELAKDLMLNTDYNISEIINRIGLNSKSYFSKIFKAEYNITPSDFRKKNRK